MFALMFFEFLGGSAIFSVGFLVYLFLVMLVLSFAFWDKEVCIKGVKKDWPFILRLSVGFGILMSMGKTFIDLWFM